MRTALLIKLLRLILDAPLEKLKLIERILCGESAESRSFGAGGSAGGKGRGGSEVME